MSGDVNSSVAGAGGSGHVSGPIHVSNYKDRAGGRDSSGKRRRPRDGKVEPPTLGPEQAREQSPEEVETHENGHTVDYLA